jgi:hopene-associated glycosyltransferase HpnB
VTLPALLGQDYPGDWRVVLVDDRSEDDTAVIARQLGNDRLHVIEGRPLPPGWTGKVWALAQALEAAGRPVYLLLTDADIRHAPGSLRRLVAESEAASLALNSRMARLRTVSPAERLLVPPFLFFFNMLYPMRSVNGSGRTAAAAGGCALVRRSALDRAGGFTAIRAEIIDDVNLARVVKLAGGRIRLSVSRSDVVSLRAYESLAGLWRVVRRTAFDELRHSWLRLAGTVAGLAVLFPVPPLLVAAGLSDPLLSVAGRVRLVLLGSAAWTVMALVFLPTVRFFRLRSVWALSLPLAGTLYGAMTVESAVRHARGRAHVW